MINRIRSAVRSMLGARNAGRDFSIREDDRLIVSYPKSGNTWIRFLVAELVSGNASFESIERTVPDIYRNADRTLARIPSPRILKSHEPFDPRYRTTLYLVRDPRDIALSYYHHHRKFQTRHAEKPLGEFVSAFISGEIDGYGSWMNNVSSWLENRGDDRDFRLVRYEDLQRDTESELTGAARHLGIETTPEAIAASVRACEFSRMQRLERQQGHGWKPLQGTRADMQFVRKGEVGSWKTELPAAEIQAIERAFGSLMRDLDYL